MPEHTIAENLTRLTTARTDIADAIIAKGGTVTKGDGFEEFPADIATIPSGGGESANMSDVNFYDYDGTIVDSYTASEFAALTAMPSNPSHEGLTAQGWNWSLTDAKAYVTKYGKLNIGQMYKTDDGALRLYIHLEEGRLSPVLGLCPNGTLTVDWGDGSATETMTGSSTFMLVYLGHTYASAGDYVISVLPSAGSTIGLEQRNNSSTILCKSQDDTETERRIYLSAIHRIEIPDSVTNITGYAFTYCYNLASITIPNNVTTVGIFAFAYCYNLASITIPDSITNLGVNAFAYCYNLASITIPDSITDILEYTFRNCSSLASITIPDSVTRIETYSFANCSSLAWITIPNSVTTVGTYAFRGCSSLASITIPGSVTSIGNNVFYQSYSLGYIKFTSTTPPTVSNSNAWTDVPTDCIIYAPALVVNLYMTGTNYPSKSTYTYAGFATYESGVTLPTTTSDETHTLTWYTNIDDLKAGTNPITVGNGNEVYAKATAI